MTPSIMRLFWDLVSQAQPSLLLHLDDDKLRHWLVNKVQQQSELDRSQESDLAKYINDRIPLIRDMAAGHS